MAATRSAELVDWSVPPDVRAVAVVLPGGAGRSRGRYIALVELGLRPLLTRLVERGGPARVATYLLRYRVRGWNGESADTLVDALWALEEIERRHGKVPVALIGNSLGGRAVFRAAANPNVVSVTGIAPWLPEDDPVQQLAGRRVLIVHGERDHTDAGSAQSLEYARRARGVTEVARFEIPGANHFLLKGGNDGYEMTTEFVLGSLVGSDVGPLLERAMTGALRTRLPPGYRAFAASKAP